MRGATGRRSGSLMCARLQSRGCREYIPGRSAQGTRILYLQRISRCARGPSPPPSGPAPMELAREELSKWGPKRRYGPAEFAKSPKPEHLMERRKVADTARCPTPASTLPLWNSTVCA